MTEMQKCPLCGHMPKLSAYRAGVWVDVSCSNPECNKYNCSFLSIETAINDWNDYARTARLSKAAPDMYSELKYVRTYLYEAHDMATDNEVKLEIMDNIKRIEALLARIDGEETNS